MKKQSQAEHFVQSVKLRLKNLKKEAGRLRRLLRSLRAVKEDEFVATLADAEMFRIVLPSAHSMPRGVCPLCKKNRAMRRDEQWFYRHDPCGIVRIDGHSFPCSSGTSIVGDLPPSETVQ